VVKAGCVAAFVRLLSSPNDDVREQAIWGLGNIAGDSVTHRDTVISNGAIPALVRLGETISEQSRPTLYQNTAWAMSNLCRCKPQPALAAVQPLLPVLAKLVRFNDIGTVADACWALSYVSDGPNERIQAVLNAGVAPRLVELLMHSSHTVQAPALRTVGNIVTGDDMQTQIMLNLDVLSYLKILLDNPKKNIRKEACWAISNIAAGDSVWIQAIISAGVFPKLIQFMESAEFDIRKEAAWAVANATSGGTVDQIFLIAELGALQPLSGLLKSHDPKLALVVLEAIENIVKAGASRAALNVLPSNPMADLISGMGALSILEGLKDHTNAAMCERSSRIIDAHFVNIPARAASNTEGETRQDVPVIRTALVVPTLE
jgi:importin subunit alpha-1